jgi:hypothetical protein
VTVLNGSDSSLNSIGILAKLMNLFCSEAMEAEADDSFWKVEVR